MEGSGIFEVDFAPSHGPANVVQVTNILRRISSTLHTATILPPLEVATKLREYSEKVPNTMCFQQGDGV